MGCSPSHSGIIQSIAKNAAKPLKKNKEAIPAGHENDGLTIPLLGAQRAICELSSGIMTLENGLEDKHWVLSQKAAESSLSVPEGDRKDRARDIADEAMVHLSKQKDLPERGSIRKQSSTGSEPELGNGEHNPRRSKKSKRQRSLKCRSTKTRDQEIAFPEAEKKVDFPELLVKAHEHAYSYLNPNLSKYEAIICMANQATETQLIMQQMITFMALRFDEINTCMEELAEDGEKMLKEVGGNLVWPAVKGDTSEHPDLLQQLLLYTVNKMQELNSTVSCLTSNALKETCSYLQSATANLQEKLKVKQQSDERLMRTIRLLESSAFECPQSNSHDMALYSEDSGIGGDTESIKERRCDSVGQESLIKGEEELISKVAKPSMDIKYKETSETRMNINENIHSSPSAKPNRPRVYQQSSFADSLSLNSLDSSTTLEQGSINNQDSDETSDSDDSYNDGLDNKSMLSQATLSQRPLSSPAGTGGYKNPSKWLENPSNEMSLKMKEAISEKIKFVPKKSRSHVWNREEDATLASKRPSTADGNNRRTSKQKRSRSAESLRSQAEDPTLVELQRTQKELGRKLELMYTSDGSAKKGRQQNMNGKSLHNENVSTANVNSSSKLKACLDKSFNILPSQERVSFKRSDKSIAKDTKNSLTSASILQLHSATNTNIPLTGPKSEGKSISPRQSVRKLIETFSPADESTHITSVKSLGPLRCVRKFGVPVLPPTIPVFQALQPLDQSLPVRDWTSITPSTCLYTSHSVTNFPSAACEDRTNVNEEGAEDLESFPPPPLEILMDDSFSVLQSEEHTATELKTSQSILASGKQATCTEKKPSASQKMKTSINVKDLLPSKNSTVSYMSIKTQEPTRKFSLESGLQLAGGREINAETLKRHEMEQAAHLYKQSCKIIPLQNPGEVVKSDNDGEMTQACADVPPTFKQKQYSPASQRKSEKIPAGIRRVSPTRATVPSPPTEKRLTNLPVNTTLFKTQFHTQKSSPPVTRNASHTSTPKIPSPPVQRKLPSPTSQQKSPSPSAQRKLPSPPPHQKSHSLGFQRKLPSPPPHQKSPSPVVQRKLSNSPSHQNSTSLLNQRKLPSPPCQRKLSSPPQGQRQPSPPNQSSLPSPPSSCRDPSPPIYCTPSPPMSPSFSYKGARRGSDDLQLSSKWIGNAQSIFCPSSNSLFETKPTTPPTFSTKETPPQSNGTTPHLRHSFSSRPNEDQHRRIAMSAANPQPFVRRSYSDRRPRVQLRLPVSISASAVSEPSLQQIGCEVPTRRESEPWAGQSLADLRASDPDLCIVGQGFQPE
ncbi:photoreceptor cilium actin regulator [Xenopus laevis]|uniref:Photoreceptor cilium actin regulator n=1 Tax=Xenopus laevis TaxID=8355 RepID=A0A8J0VAZ0_XENLA|nr:photoreceptor cilium actin regulator [Xenopus laevis]